MRYKATSFSFPDLCTRCEKRLDALAKAVTYTEKKKKSDE
jgi:hypothetical protein